MKGACKSTFAAGRARSKQKNPKSLVDLSLNRDHSGQLFDEGCMGCICGLLFFLYRDRVDGIGCGGGQAVLKQKPDSNPVKVRFKSGPQPQSRSLEIKFRKENSAQRGSFWPDIPADIRPKTSVRPSKSWKNKHFGTDVPRGRP